MGKGKFASYMAAVLAILFWGISYLWSNEIISQGVPVFIFIFFRILFAAVILLAVSLVGGRLRRIGKGDLKWFVLLSFLEPFLYFIGESYGIKITGSPTTASVIIATIPVFTLIYGVFAEHEKISLLNAAGVVLSVAGIVLFSWRKGEMQVGRLYGLLFLGLSVVSATFYTVICKKLASRYSSLEILTWQYVFGTLFFFVPFLVSGLPQWDPSFVRWSVIRPLLMLSVFASCVAYGFYIGMIRDLGLVRASVLTVLIPLVSAVAAVVTGQETLSVLQLSGIVFAILGVAFAQIQGGFLKIK